MEKQAGNEKKSTVLIVIISGRIMALADVYDALISRRVCKPAFPHEKAVSIITEGTGMHFEGACA
jgi:putative two-component system response regulator